MITRNTIYRYSRENYKDIRILGIDESINVAFYVEIGKDQGLSKRYNLSALLRQIQRGEVEVVSDYFAVPINFAIITEKEKLEVEELYKKYSDLWKEHKIEILEPSEQKKLLKEISIEWQKPVYQIKRELSKFLQYGFTKNAFIKKYHNCGKGIRRKTAEIKLGAPKAPDKNGKLRLGKNVLEEDVALIELYMNKYFYKENGYTKRKTYDKLIAEKYSFQLKGKPNIVKDEDSCITYEQFLYHANKMETNEKILKRIGQLQYDLNKRMLYSNATLEADGAGKRFLIDSTVGDVWLVDKEDRNRVIGRPVFYALIDEWSRLVVSIYVGLEGPSWNGACMALLNMIEDKVAFVKKNCSRDITQEEWPCHHIPEIILADRGEFEGTCPERLVSLLNIDLETTPPYRGDLKGIVERYFRTVNEHIRYSTPGAIKKEYNARVDQDPRLTAELDIDEVRNLIIHQVIKHNNKIIDDYPASKDQIYHNIPSIPSVLWKWSIQSLRGAVRTVDVEQFKMALLLQKRGTLSREGLRFMGAYYWTDEKDMHMSEWIPAKKKDGQIMENKFEVLYDSRNLNTIYISHKDGKSYDKLELMGKSEKYKDMNEGEILFMNKLEKENHREENQQQQQNAIDADFWQEEILKKAKKKKKDAAHNKPKTKKDQIGNVKQNRADAKKKEEQENVIRLGNEKIQQETLDQVAISLEKEERYEGKSRFSKYL